MMLGTDASSLIIYEALASEARLNIVRLLLQNREMHINALAKELYLSKAIVSTHVSKLQKAGIVGSRMKRENGGTYKYCFILQEFMTINLSPEPVDAPYHEVSIPVGQYTDYQAWPTCGIATTTQMIGQYDTPACFMDPDRVNAGILWMARGFLEYKIPNYLNTEQHLQEIEISLELSSEAPQVNENWPSDIRFSLNGNHLGTWTSPGDFGDRKGKHTPLWWKLDVNQYGVLKVLRINGEGTFMDGQRISDVRIHDLQLDFSTYWTFGLKPEEGVAGRGGLTLFGKGFGNYDQDILIRYYYNAQENQTSDE
ncbi:ArsR/SmtB family transcription factor [Paenibacillus sp. FSL H7-689]|uniref:ArsR/SmtB family transcription factor n=1 Tax=Paenibacillus sp. FSL H7-689 TaxID=1227349 RepID=UPI0003E231A0|nr:ArsR family transcriptional regulator [Paenibacillus sp. FSL H7-689]ETT43886.1 ArsR family transcriptional regulator [Paenibacillus sp. FSL H7-689]